MGVMVYSGQRGLRPPSASNIVTAFCLCLFNVTLPVEKIMETWIQNFNQYNVPFQGREG